MHHRVRTHTKIQKDIIYASCSKPLLHSFFRLNQNSSFLKNILKNIIFLMINVTVILQTDKKHFYDTFDA